ncbi:unnamed protein product [Eruca vesicaria subsp. sativa]|uniref:Uncharacterized protein n=1 Tax=Eruca vesicaria subsp. sativa TaxID=29727 RepID=A0ABC8IUF7_ERUVS|nr:unnamed protein product [Eruca vesicaria subsp. sativa]
MGVCEKTPTEEWWFDENPTTEGETVLITPDDPFEGLVEMIRIRLDLGVLTLVALTYQLPDWMLLPEGPRTPPVTLATDKDVETMLSVREYMTKPVMYVTSEPELVAKYQFLCCSPFKIGEKSFLGEGVIEEHHHQAIKGSSRRQDHVGDVFNKLKLLIVFQIALEIEMVYAPTREEREEFPHLTVEDMISIQEGEPMTNDSQNNNVQSQEDQNHQDNVSPVPRPTNGALGLPIGPNLRVTAPPPPTPNTVLVADEDDTSYTGSSDGLNDGENNSGLPPEIPISENMISISDALEQGYVLDVTGAEPPPIENGNTATLSQLRNGGTRTAIPSNGGPSLDLTLGIGVNNNHGSEAIIEIEADGDSGGFGSDPFF